MAVCQDIKIQKSAGKYKWYFSPYNAACRCEICSVKINGRSVEHEDETSQCSFYRSWKESLSDG